MNSPDVQAGFGVWTEEVQGIGPRYESREEVPITGLVGVYCSLIGDNSLRTSYAWRKALLADGCVIQALANVTGNHGFDQEDYEFPLDVVSYAGTHHVSLQEQATNASILDGLPNSKKIISVREEELARHLGYAAHNYAVALSPLRLTEIGLKSFESHFPLAHAFVNTRIDQI